MEQQIRFCAAGDGVRLAYATHGQGPPIVKVAHWFTHVEHDWHSPVWRHWWAELGRAHRVVRYDPRGCGLSDRDPERLTLDAFVGDLEAVVDAAGLDRFALLGISLGGTTAVCYAVRHPERVSHLVLNGAFARGRLKRHPSPEQRAEVELLQSIVRVGWGRQDSVFRRVFTALLIPEATAEQTAWLDELMRASASPRIVERLRAAKDEFDVTNLLGQVATPTLVAHSRDEALVPFDEARLIATRIPNARLLPLDSRNHALLATEPAWAVFVAALRAFLGTDQAAPVPGFDDLTEREREVLRLVAAGLSNDEVADRLGLSARTVERHLSNAYAGLGVSGKSARAAAAAYLARLEAPQPAR